MGVIAAILIYSVFLTVLASPWIYIAHDLIQRKKDRDTVRQRCRETVGNLAGRKIKRPPGKYIPHRWANRWLDYIHGLPVPRAQSQRYAQFSEMPRLPSARRKDR